MNTHMQELIEFNKAINALHLELPQSVWNDFHFKWIQLQNKLDEEKRQMVIDTVNDCWNCERDNGYIPVGEDYFNQKYKQ